MGENFKIIAKAILVTIIVALILGYPTKLLWNASLVDAISGINKITYLDAININILMGILFSKIKTE